MLTAAGHLKAKENLGTFHTKLIISMDVPTFSICLLLLENAKLKKKSIRTMLREEKSSISYQRLEDFDGTAATKPDDKFEPFLVDNLVLVKVSLEGKTHTHTHTHTLPFLCAKSVTFTSVAELNKVITIEPAIVADTVGG